MWFVMCSAVQMQNCELDVVWSINQEPLEGGAAVPGRVARKGYLVA